MIGLFERNTRFMANQDKCLTVAVETHGCKLNQADSLILSREFQAAGFDVVPTSSPCDVYVVNTCSVTHVADRKGRHSARAAKRRNPHSKVIVTGCYAERDMETIEAIEEVDLVFGNTSKTQIVKTVAKALNLEGIPTEPFPDFHLSDYSWRNRAMLKIQEGCNQICAYCIVPYVRGRERSVPIGEILESIFRFEREGFREVVLTGTQLGSYGFDLQDTTLIDLISSVLKYTEIPRIRLSSLQPQEIDLKLLGLWKDSRLCPHFHIPLQSGSDAVLKRMRRKYSAADFSKAVDMVRDQVQDASITSDIIVGFPGETREDYQKTLSLCEEAGFSDVHVFKFSPRPGTSANHLLDDVPAHEKSERSSVLIEAGKKSFSEFRRKYHEKTMKVLWEPETPGSHKGQLITGLTPNYIRVQSPAGSVVEPLSDVVLRFNSEDPYGDMGIFSEHSLSEISSPIC